MLSSLPRTTLSVNSKSDHLGDELARVWLAVRDRTVLSCSKKKKKKTRDECESAKKMKSEDRHKSDSKSIAVSCCDNLKIFHLTGGITNILYLLCDNELECEVLMRIYGENTEVLIHREFEECLFAELGNQVGFGPQMYALFQGGRFEEYYAGAETVLRLDQRKHWKQIAETLCEMHNIHPVCFHLHKPSEIISNPTDPQLFATLSHWLSIADDIRFDDSYHLKMIEQGLTRSHSLMTSVDLRLASERIRMLNEYIHNHLIKHQNECQKHMSDLSQCDPRCLAWILLCESVFSHNDLLGGNILYLPHDRCDPIRFIDFEYGSYQYRCFDIANHCCEYPGFDCDWHRHFPEDDHIRDFLEAYLQKLVELTAMKIAKDECDDDEEEESKEEDDVESERIEMIIDDSLFRRASLAVFSDREQSDEHARRYELWMNEGVELIKVLCCADNFFWGLWAVVQAQHSPIDFDFCQYAYDRLVVGFDFCLGRLKDRTLAESLAKPPSLRTDQ